MCKELRTPWTALQTIDDSDIQVVVSQVVTPDRAFRDLEVPSKFDPRSRMGSRSNAGRFPIELFTLAAGLSYEMTPDFVAYCVAMVATIPCDALEPAGTLQAREDTENQRDR
jgi:hypothetical protein